MSNKTSKNKATRSKVSRTGSTDKAESLELTVNKATNEIVFKDASGKVFVVQPKIIEPEPKEEGKQEPLTVDEFRQVLDRLWKMGITWTPGIPPAPIVSDPSKWTPTSQKEYSEIQRKFPRFPRELGSLILSSLLSHKQSASLVGNEEVVKEKLELIRPLLTQEYRSEFFFKHAIKVPYLEQMDWEIVVKAYERSVATMPRVGICASTACPPGPI